MHREVAFPESRLVLVPVPTVFVRDIGDMILLDFSLVIPVEGFEESFLIKEVIFGRWMNRYFVLN